MLHILLHIVKNKCLYSEFLEINNNDDKKKIIILKTFHGTT